MATVRIHICPQGDNGLELETRDAFTARTRLIRSGDSVSLPLAPVRGPAVPRRLTVKLMPRGQAPLCRHAGTIHLYRAALAPGGTAADQQDDPYYGMDELILDHLEARVSHPDHCLWERTYLAASPDGAAPPRALGHEVHAMDTLPSAINASPRAPKDTIFAMSQLELAPGEMAYAMWRTMDGANIWDTPAAAQWFRTCCLTGGYVTAAHGAPGEPESTYTVRCQGEDVLCRPTDNTAYAVGEWVSVLDAGSACRACDRTVRCTAEAGEAAPPSTGVIAPIRILEQDIAGAFGEYALEFLPRDLPRLLGVCLETAQVLAVDDEADRMDIHVDGADRVSYVPVHYRCSPDGSVSGGSAAFAPEDTVLVLKIAHTLERVVVGFSDGVRQCDVRRSTVLCFLVEKFSCLYGDLAVATGYFNEDYGWMPSSWSSHLSRGKHIAGDPAMDAYTAAYCLPTYESCYEKIYIRVWDDGSVEEVADPAAENLEIEDCFSATRWRKLIAQTTAVQCPAQPSYDNHFAVGHELVAPTHQENVLLPDGSRLALAKSMAGYAAVVAPTPHEDDSMPETLTAYAAPDPHDLSQDCVLVADSYVETREICRYKLPDWYESITGWAWALHCGCGGAEHCSAAVSDFMVDTGDQVAMFTCSWHPEAEEFHYDEIYHKWHIAHATCQALRYHSEQFRTECTCMDITVGDVTCECIQLGVQSTLVPAVYSLAGDRTPTEQRDVIAFEADLTPEDAQPLSITRPLPGSFALYSEQDAAGRTILQASGGWEIPFESSMQYTDETMEEAPMGCELTWTPRDPNSPARERELKLSTKSAGGSTPEWSESSMDELTSRLVDGLNHLVVETTQRKPTEDDMRMGRYPVALLARGRVWVPGLESEAVQLNVAGILDIIESRSGVQGYDCAVLRPWCCLRKPPPLQI